MQDKEGQEYLQEKSINQQTKQKVVVKDDDECEYYIAPIAAS